MTLVCLVLPRTESGRLPLPKSERGRADAADGRARRSASVASSRSRLRRHVFLRLHRAGRRERLAPLAGRSDRLELPHYSFLPIRSDRRRPSHSSGERLHRGPARDLATETARRRDRRRAPGRSAHDGDRPSLSGGERASQLDHDAAVPLERHRLRARRIHVGGDKPRALLLGTGRACRQGAPARDPLASRAPRDPVRPCVPPACLRRLRVLQLARGASSRSASVIQAMYQSANVTRLPSWATIGSMPSNSADLSYHTWPASGPLTTSRSRNAQPRWQIGKAPSGGAQYWSITDSYSA